MRLIERWVGGSSDLPGLFGSAAIEPPTKLYVSSVRPATTKWYGIAPSELDRFR